MDWVKDRRTLAALGLILAVVFLSYSNTLSYGFVSDDFPQILNNPELRSLRNIPRLFTEGVWHSEGYGGGIYRPVALLSWLLEYAIAGPHPFLFHLDNVILHLLCCVTVFFILNAVVSRNVSLISAALFAAHPVHTEAVAWIACRMELLCTLFLLVSFLIFIRKRGSKIWTALACASFAAALLSKESAIVLPAVMVVYGLVFEGAGKNRDTAFRFLASLSPYIVIAVVYLCARFAIVGFSGSTSHIYSNYDNFSGYRMFLLMCRASYEYIRLGFLPFGLSAEYLFMPPKSIFDIRLLLPAFLLALSIVLYYKGKIGKAAIFGISLFYIGLLPVSNIIPSGIIMAERAMYLPSIGNCILIGLTVEGAGRHLFRNPKMRTVPFALILGFFITGAVLRNPFWKDQAHVDKAAIAMIRHRIALFPDNPLSYVQLAGVYMETADYGPRPESSLKAALRLQPDNDRAHAMLAEVYFKRGKLAWALSEINAAMALEPDAGYYTLKGNILKGLDRPQEAAAMFQGAADLAPQSASSQVDLGNFLLERGDDKGAKAAFDKALADDPDNADALLGEGIILNSRRDFNGSVKMLEKAVRYAPDSPDMHYFLGVAYADAGMPGLARTELMTAVRLRPGFSQAAALLEKVP